MAFKITWKSLRLGCFKPQSLPAELTDDIGNANSARSLLLPDISDPVSDLSNSPVGSNLLVFTLAELKAVANDFSSGNFIGEGGFGPVYRGFLDDQIRPGLEAQPVAVKLLDLDGDQGHREWMAELIFLGRLRHPNLVKLIGYCCEDEHRLLVYEYMARGNLENHLFRRYSISLPWSTRIKIAVGAAKGLAFLHEEVKPVIYRDFKSSNILLDSDFNAKLSDFGLAKDGPEGDQTHVSTRVMGTQGYAAPEYVMTGHLTTMSDVYSFGVVMLELLTGRKALDKNRPSREQNLVAWAKPMLKDPNKLERLMDTRLEGQYSIQGAKKVAALAHKCLNYTPWSRPTMDRVVEALELVLDFKDIPTGPFVYVVHTNERTGLSELTPGKAEKERLIEEETNGFEWRTKVVGKKGNGYSRYRKGRKVRHRMRSRTVFSDTDLHRVRRQEVESPHKHKDEGEE